MKKAIAILGGGLHKKPDGSWRTTSFDEGDNFGADGSNIRVVAASYLAKDHSNYLIVASGGKGQYKKIPNAPTLASVIKNELLDLGINKNKIIKEDKSNNTYQQLCALSNMLGRNKIYELLIISNRYHLPRIETMLETDKTLKEKILQKACLMSAEEIVLKYELQKWKKIIDDAYNNDLMKKRIALEKKGVADIKSGNYTFI